MSAIDRNATVGQLVAERPARADVFERLGIDYCCGGRVTLGAACTSRGLDLRAVVRELEASDAARPAPSTDDWHPDTPGALADFIVATHHAYLRRELPRLSGMLDKVVAAHAARHPELGELRAVFASLRSGLEAHLVKEEWVVFPIVKRIAEGAEGDAVDLSVLADHIEHEHHDAGAMLQRIRLLTRDYTPPADACRTYRGLLAGLADFEADLHRHIHREDSILFPAVLGARAVS